MGVRMRNRVSETGTESGSVVAGVLAAVQEPGLSAGATFLSDDRADPVEVTVPALTAESAHDTLVPEETAEVAIAFVQGP